MDEEKRFLILSLAGELYALPITKLVEIAAPRKIAKDPKLGEIFEGRTEYRGSSIPVMNLRRVFRIDQGGGSAASALLVVRTVKGSLGLLTDAVTEIIIAEQKPAPVPTGIMNPSIMYYRGILRHGGQLVLLLNEDALLP